MGQGLSLANSNTVWCWVKAGGGGALVLPWSSFEVLCSISSSCAPVQGKEGKLSFKGHQNWPLKGSCFFKHKCGPLRRWRRKGSYCGHILSEAFNGNESGVICHSYHPDPGVSMLFLSEIKQQDVRAGLARPETLMTSFSEQWLLPQSLGDGLT